MRSGRSACFTPGSVAARDRHRLDRCGADLGASPGGRRAAALFPRPRHRRGGVPGRLPARAEELAAERPAARSRRLADHGRPQRRDRRRAAQHASSSRCPTTRRSPTSTTPRSALAERLDGSHYRDDILRLLFICCHPDLPATQQIALALRIVSGLTVKQIARAFLVGEAAMEQRITRAKARVADADVPFETPGAVERAERLAAVAAMIYLIFNEGYSASGDAAERRAPLCDEAIRLARLLLRLFQTEPEIMGLTALMLLQHAARRRALRRRRRGRPARRPGPRACGTADDRRGPGADRQGDAPPPARALSGAGRDRRAARPRRHARGHRLGRRSTCSTRALEQHAAVAGGHAEPRGRGVQGARAAGGARHDRAAGAAAVELFPFLRRARRAS